MNEKFVVFIHDDVVPRLDIILEGFLTYLRCPLNGGFIDVSHNG